MIYAPIGAPDVQGHRGEGDPELATGYLLGGADGLVARAGRGHEGAAVIDLQVHRQ